ncbi:hypothetical protein EJB05_19822, partial [Eragrostis curvula]
MDNELREREREAVWRAQRVRRIRKEVRGLCVDPPLFCRPGASPVKNLFHLEVVIDGPAGTPYEGGTFPIDVDLSDEYFIGPPKIKFKTEVFHPNVYADGEIALDIFREEEWSPALRLETILLSIVSVLYNPVIDDRAASPDIAELYETDMKRYEELAAEWTWEYSATPVVSHYPTEEELDRSVVITVQAAAEKAAAERQKAEERRLRGQQKAEEERLAADSVVGLGWLWRKVMAFLFRDGPLPCHY